jgi:RecG-like helicase
VCTPHFQHTLASQADNKLLEELQDRFDNEGHTLGEYGLPEPVGQKTDLERERLMYDMNGQKDLAAHLEANFPLNEEQKALYDETMHACRHPTAQNRFIFGCGVAGSGKTTVVNLIAAKLRSKGKIVKICASTTLAASLYKNGTTAHNLFKFPVQDEDAADSDTPPQCR